MQKVTNVLLVGDGNWTIVEEVPKCLLHNYSLYLNESCDCYMV